MFKIIMILFFSYSAYAGQTGPCSDDGPKFCPDVPFKNGQMFRCLLSKKGLLSRRCRTHLSLLNKHKEVCSKEIKSHCAKKPFYCLLYASNSHHKVSKACEKSILKKATYIEWCPQEIASLCPKETYQAILNCLKENKEKLGKDCLAELKK